MYVAQSSLLTMLPTSKFVETLWGRLLPTLLHGLKDKKVLILPFLFIFSIFCLLLTYSRSDFISFVTLHSLAYST